MAPRHTTGRATGKKIRDESSLPKKQRPRSHDQRPLASQQRTAPKDGSISPIASGLSQQLLDIFVTAFPDTLNLSAVESGLIPKLQEVKGHLFNRDFEAAFGRQDHLEAYAVRWSASRSLGYVEVFKEVVGRMISESSQMPADDSRDSSELAKLHSSEAKREDRLNIACLGGGAGAELCALAAVPRAIQEDVDRSPGLKTTAMNITLIDIADWSLVLHSLQDALTTPRNISPYASATAKAAALEPLLSPNLLSTSFIKCDVLSPGPGSERLKETIASVDLVTLAFTLNELYSTSISQTQTFLLDLTAAMKKGALLLVIDSAGSYSTVTVNGSEKRYPMQWLLDHTLMKLASATLSPGNSATSEETEAIQKGTSEAKSGNGADPRPVWESVTSVPSRWYRLPQDLRFPIELENMRYQLALYRRV